MAKKKKSLQPFKTAGMTVEDILNLGDDVLSKFDKRDMSHALRTVSLAANKRVNRLMKQAKIKDGKFELKKSASYDVALDSLNKLLDEAGGKKSAIKFGVGNKSRNKMYEELGRIRSFMQLKTSTIKGAVEVRKNRDIRSRGITKEEYVKKAVKDFKKQYKKSFGKKPTKKQIAKFTKSEEQKFIDVNSRIWSNYRKWLETIHKDRFYGSDETIEMVAQRTISGDTEEDIFTAADKLYDSMYEDRIREEQKAYDEQVGADIGGW